MKFLCLDCDEVMEFAERQIPGDGTLAAVFKCGSCDREMAMLTNPMETQLVSSMGVKIGGREVPTQPMELARTSLEGGRDDAFVLSEDIPLASGESPIRGEGAERRRGRRGPHCVDVGGHRPARTSAQLRPGNGEADLHRLGTREGRFGDHARKHGPGSRGVGPGRYVGLFGATELSFTYPSGRKGLGKVSLKGAPGDRVVVMGPNGSGKSTLLRLVSTELPSRPGTLELFGEACGPTRRDFRKKRELRKRIGIVQDTSVHVEDLTGMENGLLFAELYGLPRTEALEAFAALFTSLGLDDALHVPHEGVLVRNEEEAAHRGGFGPRPRPAHNGRARARPGSTFAGSSPSNTRGAFGEGRVHARRHQRTRFGPGAGHNGGPSPRRRGRRARQPRGASGQGRQRHTNRSAPCRFSAGRSPQRLTPPLTGLPSDIVSLRRLPGRIIAESRSGSHVLPQLVGAVLAAGLKIERVEIREPDLTDVFMLFTGQALGPARPTSSTGL